jgi:hypothetical protein
MIYEDPKPLKPYRNKRYRSFVASKPCLYCGSPATEAHHVRDLAPCGMGTKPADTVCVPVCHQCHMDIHGFTSRYRELSKKIGREEVMQCVINNLTEWLTLGMK